MHTLIRLREALEHSWSQDTTYCEGAYSRRNPSCGQCLVTALVLQHYFGGDIIGASFTEPSGHTGSHYWLKLNGVDVDLTWQQFPIGTKLSNFRKSSRALNLKHKNVNLRYNILLPRVEEYLKTGKIANKPKIKLPGYVST